MAKIITCQVQVLDGSNINIDVNVSCSDGPWPGRGRESATPFLKGGRWRRGLVDRPEHRLGV